MQYLLPFARHRFQTKEAVKPKDQFMGLPRAVVEAFRNRELDDYRVCKRLSTEQIESMRERLQQSPLYGRYCVSHRKCPF